MKKLFAALLISLLPWAASADQAPPRPIQECANQVPWGWPQAQVKYGVGICRQAYVLLHDNQARIPAWVAYTLTPERVIGCVPRSNAFAADQSIPVGQRSEPRDYARSGYDTGHLGNDADMSWDPVVERESFILSNMTPQLPGLNRNTWLRLESATRDWVFNSRHTFTIYAGSIYNVSTDPKIGPNQVTVPHAFFKILVDNNSRQSWAWIFPHRGDLGPDFRPLQTTVAQVESASGIVFPVTDAKTSFNPMMPISHTAFAQAKRAACGASD